MAMVEVAPVISAADQRDQGAGVALQLRGLWRHSRTWVTGAGIFN